MPDHRQSADQADAAAAAFRLPSFSSDSRIHLLLSGGGYRATLFHLGMLRQLYEQSPSSSSDSLLHNVKRVIGVSGGSIIAADFALRRDEYCANFFTAIKSPLLNFVYTVDLRQRVLQGRESAAAVFEQLFDNRTFSDINNQIELDILGTDLMNAGCLSFHNRGLSLYQNDKTNHDALVLSEEIPFQGFPIKFAVAASTAFPPFFPPVRLDPEKLLGPNYSRNTFGNCLNHEIADGGIRDNLGLEYYIASTNGNLWDPEKDLLIVSDAGLDFDWSDTPLETQSLANWGLRFLRTVDIQMLRIWHHDLSKAPHAIHVSVAHANCASPREAKALPHDQPLTLSVAQAASKMPTDLQSYSRPEAYAVIRLGYDAITARWPENMTDKTRISDVYFWEKTFPSGVHSLEDQPDKKSLKSLVEGKKKKRTDGFIDLLNSIPTITLGKTYKEKGVNIAFGALQLVANNAFLSFLAIALVALIGYDYFHRFYEPGSNTNARIGYFDWKLVDVLNPPAELQSIKPDLRSQDKPLTKGLRQTIDQQRALNHYENPHADRVVYVSGAVTDADHVPALRIDPDDGKVLIYVLEVGPNATTVAIAPDHFYAGGPIAKPESVRGKKVLFVAMVFPLNATMHRVLSAAGIDGFVQ